MAKSFFIDTTLCTACRGCQVACKQWHDLPAEETDQYAVLTRTRRISPSIPTSWCA